MIFNILLDAVERVVLSDVCGTQESQFGFSWAPGEQNLVFYADDGWITGWDHI